MLGNYHFFYDSTTWYNGSVTISNPDEGNNINITYPNTGHLTTFSTNDSTLTSTDQNCPHGLPSMSGHYRHDTIFINDYNSFCNSAGFDPEIYTTGVKY